MNREGNKTLLWMAWGMLILCFTAGIIFVIRRPGPGAEEKAEKARSGERLEIKARIDGEQTALVPGKVMEQAFGLEAERLLKEQPGPVQDSAQRARPIPLVTES